MTRLGKGLEALIDTGPESIDKTTGITTIKVDMIAPNRYQPRKKFDSEKLKELADSLKESGIIQPIIVTKKDETKYELIAGERRLEASKLAGLEEVPVIIRSVSAKEQLQFAIIENVQREDLNAIEEAQAYAKLSKEFGLKHSQIAELVGKDRVTVTNLIRLLKLAPEVQDMLLQSKLTSGHARAILQVDKNLQRDFAEHIQQENLSVRKAEMEAKQIKEDGEIFKKSTKKRIAYFERTEKDLAGKLKIKVKISGNEKTGKISLHFKSKQEFENLIELLSRMK